MEPCIVCGDEGWEPRFDVLVRCQACGFVRAAQLPSGGEAAALYSPEYFAGQEYGDYLADRDVHEKNFAARWRDMRRIAPKVESIYEIGCAYGLFLNHASRQNIRAVGIDVCAPAVNYAANELGQRATAGDFLTAPIEPNEYNAFCLWDTIEHLPHPETVVTRIAELLPGGGWLFLTTGDIGSLVARARGRHWRMIHPPTHLQYFSRQTIRQFLARHGLTVMETRAIGVYRTVHSVLSSLTALGRGFSRSAASWLSRITPVGLQKRLGLWVNLGDIMFVAAKKTEMSAKRGANAMAHRAGDSR